VYVVEFFIECFLLLTLDMFSNSQLKPAVPQHSTRTDNYQKHIEGVTRVVFVVEGEKLYVIKEVSIGQPIIKINIKSKVF